MYRVATVREESGSFVSGQGISKSVKHQGILCYGCCELFYYMFSYRQGYFVLKIIWAILISVEWFMSRIIFLHGQCKLLCSKWKVRIFFFALVGGNPEYVYLFCAIVCQENPRRVHWIQAIFASLLTHWLQCQPWGALAFLPLLMLSLLTKIGIIHTL